MIVRSVLSKDHPTLAHATAHLDVYRSGLKYGTATELGLESFNDQSAIKVQAILGGDEHVAYLDPQTLYPLTVRYPSGLEQVRDYQVVETLHEADVVRSVFQVDFPPADYTTIHDDLSAERLMQFTDYPVLNLGVDFQGYTLDVIQRVRQDMPTEQDLDLVYSIYRQRTAAGAVENELQVQIFRTPRPGQFPEAASHAEEILPPAEVHTINGETVRLRSYPSGDGGWFEATITIDRPESQLVILATDRETARAAAAALRPAVAAPILDPPTE